MISTPGAPMLDEKLFVSRFDDPFPDLYELLFDGTEWIWVNHGRPDDHRMKGAPGAGMMDSKLFVVVDDGAVWERHWRPDLGRWAWEDHGRPEDRPVIYGPGAPMLDSKFFVVVDDGALWERNFRTDLDDWVWQDHGRPDDRPIVTAPGAAMMGSKLFVVTNDGALWERNFRPELDDWVWFEHGLPGDEHPIVCAPGAAMLDSKFFVVTSDGKLWERNFRTDLDDWVWEDHGQPEGRRIVQAPGAAMEDRRFFVVTDDGAMWERHFRSDEDVWVWIDHGKPADNVRCATEPGAAIAASKLFVGTDNSHLFELVLEADGSTWVDHGTAFHDTSAHVIGEPGTTPKLEIAVMGDGYAEGDMDRYHDDVDSIVVGAFKLDQLGDHIDKVRLVRIDAVSPVTGVTERRYDEHGTPPDPSDDTIKSEDDKESRLGIIANDSWAHCWFDENTWTMPRIMSILARFAPAATHVIVLLNSGTWGGCSGGMRAIFTRGSGKTTVAHELGHNLFFLGDEYHNDDQAFTGQIAIANLSGLPASWAMLKWSALVTPGAPLPTLESAKPGGWNDNTSVGAFEGGGANFATGIFRPVIKCRMNQNDPPWCPVCGAEIARIMGLI